MTIKQQGGIFGRNPTFNDVDVEGALTVAGLPVIGGTGTMAAQDANAVAITGGNIDGTIIGATTKADVTGASGAFDSLTASGTQPLTINTTANNQIKFQVSGADTGQYLSTATYPHWFTDAAGTGDLLKINTSGNLVVNSGSGIDFSATAGTGTSELFSDYEEGTWTPIVTSGTGSITSYTSSGKYTKVGRIVTVEITYIITNNGTGASYGDIAGLPYTASVGCVGVTRFNGTTGLIGQYSVVAGSTSGTVWNYNNTYPWATNAAGTITITYSV
jgi:hypothetical protein